MIYELNWIEWHFCQQHSLWPRAFLFYFHNLASRKFSILVCFQYAVWRQYMCWSLHNSYQSCRGILHSWNIGCNISGVCTCMLSSNLLLRNSSDLTWWLSTASKLLLWFPNASFSTGMYALCMSLTNNWPRPGTRRQWCVYHCVSNCHLLSSKISSSLTHRIE